MQDFISIERKDNTDVCLKGVLWPNTIGRVIIVVIILKFVFAFHGIQWIFSIESIFTPSCQQIV